jgi:hypothetical protein
MTFSSTSIVPCLVCAHCHQAILGQHYHCSSCGPSDICPNCFSLGGRCGNPQAHKLIERTITNGQIVTVTHGRNSTKSESGPGKIIATIGSVIAVAALLGIAVKEDDDDS